MKNWLSLGEYAKKKNLPRAGLYYKFHKAVAEGTLKHGEDWKREQPKRLEILVREDIELK